MKLTGTAELAVVAALVGLISFMPMMLSALVSSPIGKAVAFGFVAYLWKQHNELVALLLAVALVKACPAYERMTDVEKAAMEAAALKEKEKQHPPIPTENMAPKY
jgi:hypothetical protein